MIQCLVRIKQDYELKTGLAVALGFSFMLMFFAPLELYLNNKYEFWFDFFTLFPVLIVMFVVGMIINLFMLIILFLVNKFLYRIAYMIEFIAFIIMYIQGNLLIKNLPPLDGTQIQWEIYGGEQIKSIILIMVVFVSMLLLLSYFKINKLSKAITGVSLFITLMLFVTGVSLFFLQNGSEQKLSAIIKTENQLNMSTDKNYIILLVDSVDAGAVSEIFEKSPKNETIFEDFTYYPNTMGTYSFTQESIPYLFSGEWYEHKEPFQNYNRRAYADSKLLYELEEDGFQLNLYEPDIPLQSESIYRFHNISISKEINSVTEFSKILLRLVGFKYLPYGLKQYSMADIPNFKAMSQFNELRSINGSETCSFFSSNRKMYNKLEVEEITFSTQKEFKFIHVEGAHVPFVYDEEMRVIDESQGSYERNVMASLTLVERYLNKLKESDVYDNSVIIVMSDHGYSVDEETGKIHRQNPAFFAKGFQEKHSLTISNAPISYVDLQNAFMKLKAGNSSDDIFEWSEGDLRERRYLSCVYLDEGHMTEYIQTGNAWDISTMYKTGREFNQ